MSAAVKLTPPAAANGVSAAEVADVLVPPRMLYRLSVEQYHRIIEAGIIPPDERHELLEGLIVKKMSHNPPHDASIMRLGRRLIRALPDDWIVRLQSAVTFQGSEPEPDFLVARGPEARYSRRHPAPRDVELIGEVSDSSLLADRRDKGLRYARVRIPQYWIVNLVEECVEVYTAPRGGRSPGYQQRQDYGPGEMVPVVLLGQQVAVLSVSDLLPG